MATQPAILVLADGNVFHGQAFGKIGTTTGEICFNTGMTGYQEVFTDPSYTGQIIIMSNVHIGNYGVKATDVESKSVKIHGLIGRNLEEKFSRAQADGNLNDYLIENNIVSIEGLDTRVLVAHVRTSGAMNCIISSDNLDIDALKAQLAKVPSMDGLELASTVSTKEVYELGDVNSPIKVAVLDFGVKQHILQCLIDRGAHVRVHPAKTDFTTLKAFNPTGYFLSNGPGDPAPMDYAVKTIKSILEEKKPLFGICLGHQILGLAVGAPTFKLKFGHRGGNHPVRNEKTGFCEISVQNHGFATKKESIPKGVEITHLNLNDNTVEGIEIPDAHAFSVQYHPECSPGPHDSSYLFEDFYKRVEKFYA